MSVTSQRFLGILFVCLLFAFGIHLLALDAMEQPLWGHRIVLAYLINYILAGLVLLLVERSMRTESAQAGFMFLAGSALKFIVFFLVFYPVYKRDDVLETAEFITFFVPYGLCLILEVIYLSKRLNNQ